MRQNPRTKTTANSLGEIRVWPRSAGCDKPPPAVSEPQSIEDDKTASDVQFGELLRRISGRCMTEAGQASILSLRPLPNIEAASRAQTRVRETLQLEADAAPLPITRVVSIVDLCDLIDKGQSGSARQLLDASRLAEVALRIRAHVHARKQSCPELEQLLWCSPELGALRDAIQRAIDDEGEIRDSASDGVRSSRRALQTARDKLRTAGQKLIARYKDVLSGQFVAERGGRTVLPVRADASGSVPGMILGTSGSGSSLYVEPSELTELNNRIYVCEAELEREEAKVLADLSGRARALVTELRQAETNCTEADKLSAIARWAHKSRACPVQLSEVPKLILKQMRHPLLIADSADAPDVVPNDIRLLGAQCLVVSGPNAGGKTVALKCLGLAVWLAQSGIPVPCAPESEIGWFDEVMTDVGDEQSISQSLSTFSAHVRRISQYLGRAKRGTLILMDEIAGGTDPEEGAALAAAVLSGFVERGASVAVTTHYEKLKQLGAEREDFLNASVGFDFEHMRPTYELSLGIPGQSSALAVAERYGVPRELVERARELLPKEQVQQQQLLEQLERERAELAHTRQSTEAELEQQRRISRKLEAETARARELERERLRQEAQALTREVMEARTLVRKAKAALDAAGPEKASLKQAERLLSDGAQPVTIDGNLTAALATDDDGATLRLSELQVGMRVRLSHLKAEGEIVAPPKKQSVLVNVGGLKMSVPVTKLRALERGANDKPAHLASPARPRKRSAAQPVAIASTPSRTSSNTCDLRGMRVEEGLDQVDSFIDSMLQANEPALFVLHGHGTGAMKEAVREHLGSSPYVSKWEPAPREDGGDALTICWL